MTYDYNRERYQVSTYSSSMFITVSNGLLEPEPTKPVPTTCGLSTTMTQMQKMQVQLLPPISTSISTQTGMSVTSIYHFEYLKCKQPHRDKTHPTVKRVKIWDGSSRIKIMGVEYCNEAHNNARDGQCMKYRMEQLDIDSATAATHTVQQYS